MSLFPCGEKTNAISINPFIATQQGAQIYSRREFWYPTAWPSDVITPVVNKPNANVALANVFNFTVLFSQSIYKFVLIYFYMINSIT